ncbi:MAG: DNA-processing protein DprA [Anaerobiospirillum succiniciproducens]|uniref:DNA-processing protein DprA n=1 Tax=Anaerobiospirillum succiniciproducens TaxID=13335 RepID=UPI002A766983|nr:DNA-processing protein DprA [Anaerobiospirillum succiniciproducens]MDY2798152.1 DNA-processing protein DprA [Anaerobiospirillum succiniciproducens]
MALTTSQILALQTFKGVGPKSILKVGNSISGIVSASELLGALAKCSVKKKNPDGARKAPITATDLDAALKTAQEIIDRAKTNQIGIISYYEQDFPSSLRHIKSKDDKTEEPAILLFYKGDLNVLKCHGLAVIGTRNNTANAQKAGLYLSTEFARRGFCIVSGLAEGCDTIAHRGALNAGGKTIAFLGHGLDTVYPPSNKDLADEILLNGGLLLSEYDVGTPVTKYNLVARDRLQAGLALATLVIQTSVNGGSMHAARVCLNSGKPLFVVKYSDKETDSAEQTQGNHELAKEAGAAYIKGTDDLDVISNKILNSGTNKEMTQKTLFWSNTSH